MDGPILKVTHLKKSFSGNLIHNDVNFELKKGESLGLLGGSGTGKSVLLRAIISLELINQGKITYRDNEIQNLLNEKKHSQLCKSISYSFQSGALFDSKNVFENLSFPLLEHTSLTLQKVKEKVAHMLKLIGLEGIEELMPSDLSGGMQKRVGMARALILDPEIILYDEPTAGLDPSNTQKVVELMKTLKQSGQSSIFVTHDIQSAKSFCDRLLILKDGKIFFNGTPQDFESSKDPEVMKFFMNSQGANS